MIKSDMEERRQRIRSEFQKLFGKLPSLWARAPGRVDLMGSHTDYNMGFVMTMSIDRDTWIAANPENKQFMNLMENIKQSQEEQVQSSDVGQLWNKVAEKAGISSEIEESTGSIIKTIKWSHLFQPKVFQILRYAAVLVILITLPYVIYQSFSDSGWFESSPELLTLTVPKGDRQEVILSDGSRIMLDAGSHFSHPKEFTGNSRDVYLNGEGYFEVQSNPEKPFVVHAGDAVIKVLGTKFNVRAWQAYKRVRVAVAEGKVSLNSEQGTAQDAVILTEGLAGTLLENGLPSQPQEVDMDQYLGWMHNEVIFDNAPLEEILFQLERWYDLKFVLSDSSLAREHLTVHIQSTPVKDIVELIATLTDLNYKFAGNTVRFSSKDIN